MFQSQVLALERINNNHCVTSLMERRREVGG